MTEKENEIELEPVTGSQLPLVSREDTPPLLLDLPDGQQLVVGKLPDGIVIEIATWRGTGRPDSRTNRMMLGVSYDEELIAEEKIKKPLFKARKKIEEEKQSIGDSYATILEGLTTSPDVVLNIESPAKPVERPIVVPAETVTPAEENLEQFSTEIRSELAEIVAEDDEHPHVVVIDHRADSPVTQVSAGRNLQDLFGARPRTQVSFDGEISHLDSKAHEIVKKEKAVRNSNINIKKTAHWIAYPAVVGLILFLAAGPGRISITHPVAGVKTSLSSAENALVLVRGADSYSIGDNVVANVEADGSPVIFGSIAATSDTEYVLTENNLYHSSLKSEVKGKVLLVMPGLGFLAGLIGR